MNFRETLQKNPNIGYTIAGTIFFVAGVSVFRQVRELHGNPPGVSTKAYYTTEDQLTGQAAVDALFIDDVNRVPPFDHDGKPAFLAIVYECNHGRTRWVNGLQKWNDKVLSKVQAIVADAVAKGAVFKVDTTDLEPGGLEVKVPGPGPWYSFSDPQAGPALNCHIPPDVPSDDVMFAVP